MFNISVLHQGTIVMDAAAVFLLLGVWVNTTIYRKRGHFDDVMYAQLIIMTIIMSISDACTYVIDGGTMPHGAIVNLICNYIFFNSFELICGMFIVYLDYRVHRNLDITKKRKWLIMIPTFAMNLLFVANIFFRFIFWVDTSTCEYFQYPLYPLIFIGPAIYALWGLYYLFRINYKVIWLYVLLLAIRVFLGNILQGVSSTGIIFSMGLVFVHIQYMRLPFYEKEGV